MTTSNEEGPRSTTSQSLLPNQNHRQNNTPRISRQVIVRDKVPALHDESSAAMLALVQGNAPIFTQDGRMVQITRINGMAGASTCTIDSLRHLVSQYALFVQLKRDQKTGELKRVEVHPPKDTIRDLLARGDWAFPALDGIVRHPVMTPDGELVASSGYDEKTRLFLDLDETVDGLTIPANPTEEEVSAAVELIHDIVADFPFDVVERKIGEVGAELLPADRTAAEAMLLTILLRTLIPGPVPIFIISAPAPGTGKTLLVQALSLVVLGEDPAMIGETRDGDEFQKTLVSLFMTSPEIVVIDNLSARIDSGLLAMVATSGRFQGRILKVSEMANMKVRAVLALTANNPAMSNELSRRSIPCRMIPNQERPWQRDGFRHENLKQFVRQKRPDLLRAGFILARAWINAGRPKPSGKPLGSFEEWFRTIGGIAEHANLKGFLANSEGFYLDADQETLTWNAFVDAWYKEHDTRLIRASELLELALKMEIIDEGRTPRATQTAMGRALVKMNGRTYGGMKIKKGPFITGVQYWQLFR